MFNATQTTVLCMFLHFHNFLSDSIVSLANTKFWETPLQVICWKHIYLQLNVEPFIMYL